MLCCLCLRVCVALCVFVLSVAQDDVRQRFGVDPALVPDVQALAGDEADNCTLCEAAVMLLLLLLFVWLGWLGMGSLIACIPVIDKGVPGIGLKTASKLIADHGCLEVRLLCIAVGFQVAECFRCCRCRFW